jgi:hypothetical protein
MGRSCTIEARRPRNNAMQRSRRHVQLIIVQVLKLLTSGGPLVLTPMSSSVEAAVTSGAIDFCWLRAGCHWETASEMIFAVSEVI